MSPNLAHGKDVSLGAFHGDGEGYAKVRTFLAAVCALAVLAYPWMNVFLLQHHPGPGKPGHLLTEAISATVVWAGTVFTYSKLYHRLGVLIAVGTPDAAELDKVRSDLSSFALGAGFLAMLVWWSGVLSASL